LLNDLARQISSTAETVRLSDDLERARFRIVEAEEETRRRLGSDRLEAVANSPTLRRSVSFSTAGSTQQSEDLTTVYFM